MASILVGVDGSEDSRNALRWAVAVAGMTGLRVRALQAWQYPIAALVAGETTRLPDLQTVSDEVERGLRTFLAEALGDAAKDVQTVAGAGPAARALLEAAAADTAMLVVGSRGLGGFEGLRLGSVSRQVTEHAPCPVTVIRRGTPLDSVRLERIVVGIDGSSQSARAVGFAGRLAKRVGADLLVAHAATYDEVEAPPGPPGVTIDLGDRDALVERWCEPLRRDALPYRITVVEGDARTALLEVVETERADLLVVGTRGRGPVARLLLGSVATSLLQQAPIPVTVVPPHLL